jgi:hypothetical protein
MDNLQRSDEIESKQSAAAQSGCPRMQRIADYLAACLSNANALEANLGIVNSDLLLIAFRLKQTIDQAQESGAKSLEELDYLLPAIETYLQITKQIDRFSRLELKLKRDRDGAR